MTDERWQRILRIMDTASADYLTGMTAPAEARRGRREAEAERRRGSRPPPTGTAVTPRATGFGGAASACARAPTSRLTFDGSARLFAPSVTAAHRPRSRPRREGQRPHPTTPSQNCRSERRLASFLLA